MSDSSTRRMVQAYVERAPAPRFLSSNFTLRPENIHNGEKIEIDIQRSSEDVAVPIPDVSTGPRMNENDKYTNKAFTPPIFKEAAGIEAWEQIKRQPGQNPFEDPNFLASAGKQALTLMLKMGDKIGRACELMAAQVLQDGVISLKDSSGAVVYTVDFLMKSSHKITVGTAWATDGSTGAPLADISAAARLIRKDGKMSPNKITFGASAIQRFLANAKVQDQLDKTKLNIGALAPSRRSEDATFIGKIWIDNYEYEMWRYDAYFVDPQTATITPYISDDNLVISCTGARMDMSMGTIPMFMQPDQRAVQFLPPQVNALDQQVALTTNAWVTPNGESLFVQVGGRPLMIPTAIDTFARIDVTP